jgi:hypothetical protein
MRLTRRSGTCPTCAKAISPQVLLWRSVRRAEAGAISGNCSANVLRTHVGFSQKNRRTFRRNPTARP